MLTWNDNIKESLFRSGAKPIVICELIKGGGATAKFTNAATRLFGYENSVSTITPISQEVDPVERKVSVGEMNISLIKGGIGSRVRYLFSNVHAKNATVNVYLGTSEIVESDFELIWSGLIDELEPDYDEVNIKCVTFTELDNKKAYIPVPMYDSVDTEIRAHPAEVALYILENLAGIPTAKINTSAFAYDVDTTKSHLATTGTGQMLDGGDMLSLKKGTPFYADTYGWNGDISVVDNSCTGCVVTLHTWNSITGGGASVTLTEGVDWIIGVNVIATALSLYNAIVTSSVTAYFTIGYTVGDYDMTFEATAITSTAYPYNVVYVTSDQPTKVVAALDAVCSDFIQDLEINGVRREIANDDGMRVDPILITASNAVPGYFGIIGNGTLLGIAPWMAIGDPFDMTDAIPLAEDTKVKFSAAENGDVGGNTNISGSVTVLAGARPTPHTSGAGIARVDFFNYLVSCPLQKELELQDMIDEIAAILQATIYRNVSGSWSLKYYDSAASVDRALTKSDITSLSQESIMSGAINRSVAKIKAAYLERMQGGDDDGEVRDYWETNLKEPDTIVNINDTTAQDDYSTDGVIPYISELSKQFNLVSGVGTLYAAISASASSMSIAYKSSGYRCPHMRNYGSSGLMGVPASTGSQPTARKLASTRKAYFLIDDEIIECNAQSYISSGTRFYYYDDITDDEWYPRFNYNTTYTISDRGCFDTVAAIHGFDAIIYDVTALVLFGSYVTDRFSYGMQSIKFTTSIAEAELEIGDTITIEHDAYVAYGIDGIEAGDAKFEITAVEVDPIGDIGISFTAVRK